MSNELDKNQIEVDLNVLRKHKVMLGLPMYGGGASGPFTQSIMGLMHTFAQINVKLHPFFIFNESLVTRARNYIADEFMRSDCTHLLFIDADIDFTADDVITLLHYSISDNLDIVCGPYTKKNISWEKVKAAVDMGLADDDPNILSKYTGDYVFNPVGIENVSIIDLRNPLEVSESGTGFMLIKRDVMEEFVATYPELLYTPDHARSKDFGGARKITGFFLDPLDEGRHLSEDYFFCKWCRKMGRKVWILPWLKLGHYGSYLFEGDLVSIMKAKMSPTIKVEDAKKIREK